MIIGNIEKMSSIEKIGSIDESYITIRRFSTNRENELYMFRKAASELYILVDGEIWINGERYTSGTTIFYDAGERRNYFILRNATFITIANPNQVKLNPLELGSLSLADFSVPYQCDSIKCKERFNNIKYQDITVIIQGAVDPVFTPLSIKSVRKHLPGSRIVLSTWEGSSYDGLDYDELILNDDPGAPSFVMNNGTKHYDNRNRLLVSTQGGLKSVQTQYALKIRTDCILVGDGIVRNYGRYPKKSQQLNIFKNKLVVGEQCNVLRLYFESLSRPYLFHISDWFFFGLTDDLKEYFLETAVESTEQMTKWNYKNEWPSPEDDEWGRNFSPRYNSEQYYFVSALSRKHHIDYYDASDYSEKARIQSETAIVNNFEILNIKDHEIVNAKKQNKQAWDLGCSKYTDFLTNEKYEELYNAYT